MLSFLPNPTMIRTRMKQIPAIYLVALLFILCGWHFSSADEAKDKSSIFGLSDLFSSLSSGDGSASISTKNGEFSLSSEQLSSLLEQLSPKKQQGKQGDHARNNHGHSRRKLLYDLSVKGHYGKLLRPDHGDEKNSSVAEKETVKCIYFNEGVSTLKDISGSGDREKLILSKFSYWTFKLCPQESIQQVHLVPVTITSENSFEPIGDVDFGIVNDGTMLKLPSDSVFSKNIHFMQSSAVDLGAYDSEIHTFDDDFYSIIKKAWGPDEQDMYKTSTEYYFSGSTCQYKQPGYKTVMGKMRRSKVVYDDKCCKRDKRPIDEFFHRRNDMTILSVTEPIICQYTIKLCKYCPDTKAQETKSPTPEQTLPDDASLSSVDPSDLVHLMQTYLHHTTDSEATSFEPSDHYNPPGAFPPMPPSQIEANKKLLRDMFTHAYDSYMYNAFPASELHPISCAPGQFNLVKIPALTLIDTLDTLIIMNNYTEFARSVERIRYLDSKMRREHKPTRNMRKDEKGGLFSLNQNVSLFETTIRVLGGLLSAHQLALAFMHGVVPESQVWDSEGEILWGYKEEVADESIDMDEQEMHHTRLLGEDLIGFSSSRPCIPRKEPNNSTTSKSGNNQECWHYDGLFLRLAHDIGKRLVHAFDTETGIPFGTVNLLRGVPSGETEIASLAGAGTLTLEFELLSRLTGDALFGKMAKRASRSLWMKRARGLDLLGKHVNVKSGQWTESLSGIGSNSDSFYEYLLKHYVLFPDDDDFWTMFMSVYAGVWKHSRLGDWYVDVDMYGLQRHVKQTFESLMAFWPGMQLLLGELAPAAKTLSTFFLARELLGLLPERFDFVHWRTEGSGDVHPLRPELLESAYFAHLASIGLYGSKNGPCRDSSTSQYTSSWLWAADFALHAIVRLAWVKCGFATVMKVGPQTTGNLDFVNGISNNPHTEQSRLHIKHHNEMPSFFLSETIKYLYLLFDAEENILHQDTDREWIFTTEAHPIHYEIKPTSNATDGDSLENSGDGPNNESNLNVQMEKIRELLKKQIRLSSNQTAADNDCMIKGNCPLSSRKILPQILLDELEIADNITIATKTAAYDAFGLMKGPTYRIMPHQNWTEQYDLYSSDGGMNYAYNHLHRLGNGINLGRKCPNFNNPRLTWTLALHGDTIDYNLFHKSSASDVDEHLKAAARMQTALHSTLYYGTDYYSDGISIDKDRTCPYRHDKTKPMVKERSKNKLLDASHNMIPGATRYDMGNGLGLFDVSAFANGDGFVVRHVESGELLEVSMFTQEISPGSFTVLACLTTPSVSRVVSSEQSRHPHLTTRKNSLKMMFQDTLPSPNSQPDAISKSDYLPEKRVVVADMNGHSYTCEIIIHDDSHNLHLPCSPGFFGKAHIEQLIIHDGVSVRGPLKTPPKGDSNGCQPPNKDDEINASNFCLHDDEARNIQLVYRGDCNFAEKTLNQRLKRQAAAVIVINSNPAELFCMAGDKDKTASAEGCDQMDYPAAVLVTGNDGDWLLSLIEDKGIDINKVEATVSISRQSFEGSVDYFPFVKGSENTIQILASNGWGAQAVHQDSASDNSNSGWQLFITTHEQGNGASNN